VLEARKSGYQSVVRGLSMVEDLTLVVRLPRDGSQLEFVRQVRTGIWPKQVIPSPDGRYLFIPLLKDTGIDVIDLGNYATGRIIFPERRGSVGYAEGIFNPAGDRLSSRR
jgi:hypothetical protein